jgi:hypothetical protein
MNFKSKEYEYNYCNKCYDHLNKFIASLDNDEFSKIYLDTNKIKLNKLDFYVGKDYGSIVSIADD